ncbi:TonB-dependent receptor [Sphingobacterium sp.]|uniref:SusC/RagA family TonB-linked outer membrane protein n=1 Tax=Sphingobacterium sp. TaxID=341027 RepID=UPI0031D71544
MNFNQQAQNLCRWTMPSSVKKVVPAFLLLFSSQLDVTASAQRISLSLNKSSFREAVEAIKKQSGYELVLVQSHLGDTHPVSINLQNKSLRESLEALTKDQPVGYEIKGNTIVLNRKKQTAAKAEQNQQLETIKGKITDPSGAPLNGVTVKVKGTNKVTQTDNSGNFSIEAKNGAMLVISSIGFATVEVAGNTQSALNISLKKEDNALNEVVVVGYGTQKRKSLTGSVASVKMSDVNNATNTNFAQGLAGRAAGVNVVQTSGQPGAGVSVQIRSNASFASMGPLYIVDGVIVNDDAGEPTTNTRYGSGGVNRSPLNFINPNDIENIDILKDASATAIYGARAAGGVVLITTKKGKQGLPTIQYDFSHAIQKSLKYYDILGTKDYMLERNKILREKWMLDNKIGPYGNVDPGSVSPFVPKYTQEQIDKQQVNPSAIDAIMRTGKTQQHNLSMSGTSNKTSYYISGNYLNQEGVLRNSDYSRYSGKFNLDQGIGENIKVGINVIGTGSKANNGSMGDGVYENSGMIGAAFYYPPTMPFQDEKGNYPINPDYQNTPNPLSFLTITDLTNTNRWLTSAYAEWKVFDGLTAKASFSYDKSTAKRSLYYPRTFLYGARAEGQAGVFETNASSKLREYTLNYAKDIGKGHLTALLGHSYQISERDGLDVGNDHFPTDNFLYYNIGLGTAQRPFVGSSKAPNRIWKSYFARVVYEYDGKYILSGTVRKDGASHFAANKKWGTFPGVSAAWVASEEEFIKAVPAISFLKLRAGYGAVGNSAIGGSAFAYYENQFPYVIGNVNLPGVGPVQLANPDLTWETQTEFNLGLDFGFVNGRVSGSFDYFNRQFTDLLSKITLPMDNPVTRPAYINAGKTRSQGWEVNLQTKNIVRQDGFNWNTTINFSHYKNYWVNRAPAALQTLPRYEPEKGNFNAQYGYLSDGIYNPANMSAPSWMPGILPGEIIIKDVNGYDDNGNLTGKPDGKLSTADMVLLHTNNDPTGNGQPVPNYSFGMNNQFTYKNFDLSVYMYGLIQKKTNRDYSNNSDVYAKLGAYGWNVLSIAKDRWAYDNMNGTMPTGLNGSYSNYAGSSDFWLENGNFLRVRDITLGYRLPMSLLQRQKTVKNVRVYLNVQNPFIITNYKGVDPELQNLYAYPMTKSFTVGASVGF